MNTRPASVQQQQQQQLFFLCVTTTLCRAMLKVSCETCVSEASRVDASVSNFELLELRRQREEIALLKEELLKEVYFLQQFVLYEKHMNVFKYFVKVSVDVGYCFLNVEFCSNEKSFVLCHPFQSFFVCFD
jgi:hypothetical protein